MSDKLEFRGTKGEWKLENNGYFYEVKNNRNYLDGDKILKINVFLNQYHTEGEIKDLSSSKENEAIAKLIASAPELLKALQDFTLAVENEDIVVYENLDPDGFASTPNKIYNEAKKAIEKALK